MSTNPSPSILLRDAVEQDAGAIAQLHADSWRSAYREFLSKDYLDHRVLSERSAVWRQRFSDRVHNPFFAILAEIGGQLAGFACVFPSENAIYGSFLDNLHVTPNRVGQGIGQQLMKEVARRLLVEKIGGGFYLWVIERNSRARRFYANAGGVEVERADLTMADGSRATEIRCHWPDPAILLR